MNKNPEKMSPSEERIWEIIYAHKVLEYNYSNETSAAYALRFANESIESLRTVITKEC